MSRAWTESKMDLNESSSSDDEDDSYLSACSSDTVPEPPKKIRKLEESRSAAANLHRLTSGDNIVDPCDDSDSDDTDTEIAGPSMKIQKLEEGVVLSRCHSRHHRREKGSRTDLCDDVICQQSRASTAPPHAEDQVRIHVYSTCTCNEGSVTG